METRLETCLRSGTGMLWVATMEEDRSIRRVQAVAEELRYAVFGWTGIAGFVQLSTGDMRQPGDGHCMNIDQALNAVAEYNHERAVFVMQDLDLLARVLQNTPDYVVLVRRIRDLYRSLKGSGNAVAFVASSPVIPTEFADCLTLVEASLPTQEERLAIIRAWIDAYAGNVPCEIDDEGTHRLASAAAGMSSRRIQAALATSAVNRKALTKDSLDDVVAEKVAVVKTTGLLEYVRVAETLDDVGGLAGIKDYVAKRSLAFGRAAQRYGLPMPKGILILGPPGTGKSLVAKASAQALGMALLRFDVGRVQASLVGQSEERMRHALAVAESQAPCVLWIDELEKAFAGANGAAGDSGVTQRLFGHLLTWMQERTTPVFIVATANDISQLRPEFLRKGRFDEIFFVDLPTPSERRAILQVILRQHGQTVDDLITDALIKKLDRYTGAEAKYVVTEAMYEAFDDDQRPISVKDLEAATTRILPIADQMRTEIEALRRWGKAQRTRDGVVLRFLHRESCG